MPSRFRSVRTVEFAETDMAGIMHFSNFYRYMEATEHEFFRSLGLVIHQQTEAGMTGFARVQADCKFFRPLHYLDEVEVELVVTDKTRNTLEYEFLFRRLGPDGPEEKDIARGTMKVIHVKREGQEQRIRAAEIPDHVAALIEVEEPTAPGPKDL